MKLKGGILMVSSTSITFMWISAIVCFLFPIIVLLYSKKKEKISLKPFFVGMAVFVVFVMILEKCLHTVVIGNKLITNPILFSIYGAFAAGIFEEGGRFIAFKTVLKKKHEWKDGLSYGIGHGGIEAILLAGVANIQNIVYSNLINNGTFDTVIGGKVPASQLSQIDQLKQMLIQTSASNFLIGMAERIFAFGIQIALTMVVLYAIKNRKNIYLFIAILLHALIDFPAALCQAGIINVFVTESLIAVFFIISIIFILKTKKNFNKEVTVSKFI